jgi:chromate reductase, NAD(P)H dehydrogenase (quinone)
MCPTNKGIHGCFRTVQAIQTSLGAMASQAVALPISHSSAQSVEVPKMSKIVALSGSLRKGSFNTMLLRACQELSPGGMTIEIFDLQGIPFYNADVHEAGVPDEVTSFVSAVREADGVLIACPEYNRSVPAVLKNAIDWASKTPPQAFDNKPIAITGASRGSLGTIMANHHLRQIFVYLNGRMVNGPEVLVPLAGTKFDEAGRLVDDATGQALSNMLKDLQRLV